MWCSIRRGDRFALKNDFVLALIGYHPDYDFLRSMGIELSEEQCRPVCDPVSLESNVPGIYVAGVIVAGSRTNEIFIENGRFHGKQIAARSKDETDVVSSLRKSPSGLPNRILPTYANHSHGTRTRTEIASISLPSYVRLLRHNRNFRRLWLAQIVSEIGDWFYTLSIYTLLLQFTGTGERGCTGTRSSGAAANVRRADSRSRE